jgi:heterodisulfide reductase subunit A
MKLGLRKAIYVPFPQAVPLKYTIDMENCVRCGLCEAVCQPKAVNFEQEEAEVELRVGAVVIATGFELDDAARREEYGYGRYENVITTLHLERLLSPSGPTGGHIIRPSDGKIPRRIAFIQCVCSRDEKTNLYCSRFCCMYAIKNSMLLKDHVHNCDVAIFYMDVRTFGKGYEELYRKAEEEYGVRFIKARPAEITENPATRNLTVKFEDIIGGKIVEEEFDLVVLSVGVIPPGPSARIHSMLSLTTAEDGFLECEESYLDAVTTPIEGVFAVGGAESPKDISDTVTQASAAAMRASIILKD